MSVTSFHNLLTTTPMGYIDEKVAQLSEALKNDLKPQAIDALRVDAQNLDDKAQGLEAEMNEARAKAASIRAEIDAATAAPVEVPTEG